MKRYAKVENNAVTKVIPKKPVRLQDGEDIATESWLIENEGIYPIKDDPPEHNKYSQTLRRKAESDWSVEDDHVLVTYDIEDRSVSKTRQKLNEAAKRQRDRILRLGVWIALRDNWYRHRADDTGRAALDQAALDSDRRADWQEDWRAASAVNEDGEPTEPWISDLTKDELETMRSAVAVHKSAAWKRLKEIEDALKKAETVDDLLDVDIEAGWPDGGKNERSME